MSNFRQLLNSLPEEIENKLNEKNITSPTKVQEMVIPLLFQKKDTLFESATGTGKTLAYLLPLFTILENEKKAGNLDKSVKVIIVSPTFELASQIKNTVLQFSHFKAALLIGGSPIKRQEEALKEKPEFVIGTPARINELIRLKKLKTQGLISIVFDEVDRLLKKEIVDEVKVLLSLIPENTQKIALSATIDEKTKKFFPHYEKVFLPKEDVICTNISHWAIYAENRDKIDILRKLINALDYEKILIFTSRADQVMNISSKLKYKNINCVSLHAKSDGRERKTVIDRFRSGKEKILITSDLASRGLDIPGITHIIQMDLPSDDDFFVHRAGRTARAGKKGTNIVIGDEWEMRHYASLEKKLKIKVFPKEIRKGKIQEPEL